MTTQKIMAWFAWAALTACPLVADGIFTVPADVDAGKHIVIDGTIEDDGEWTNAVRLTNFQLENKAEFASEQTVAYLTHDNETLYIGLRLSESVLLQASNRDAKFLANVKPGDKNRKVWEDDSVEVRLRPPWVQKLDKKSQFWMIVNANGATDATAPDGLAQDWPSQGKIATGKGDGFWTVEMAFPLKTFFPNGFSANDLVDWKMNFLRFEKNLDEISSFANITGKGHYETAHYATMTLAANDALPAARMVDFGNGALKPVNMEYHASKRLAGWYWGITESVSQPKKRKETSKQAIFQVGKGKYPVSVSYENKGHYNWFFLFTHSATGKPITWFRTPSYPASSDIGPVSFQFQRPENIRQVRLNQKVLSAMENGTLEVLPHLGENTLTVKTQGGAASASISLKAASTAGIALPILNWQYMEDDNGKWQPAKATFDASTGWLTVTAEGTAVNAREYRSVLYDHVSSISWFGESQDISVNADGAVAFIWEPNRSRIPWNTLGNRVELTLLLPEWLTVTGASSWEINGETTPYMANQKTLKNHYNIERGSKFKNPRDGVVYQPVTVYSDSLGEPFADWDKEEMSVYLRTRCVIGLKASADAVGKNAQMAYYVSVNGQPEIPQFRGVRCLAQLTGLQPKDARFTLYMNQFTNCGSSLLLEGAFKTAQGAGITEVFVGNIHTPVKPFNLGQSYFFHMRGGFSPMEANMSPAFAKMPWLRGWGSLTNLVALNRLPDAWKYLDEEFEKIKKRSPYTTNLLFDYEFPPFNHYSDVSEATLKVFAETYGIAETPLNQAVIQQKYLEKWVDFRCKELAATAQKLRKLAERHGLEFSMYGTPSPRWKTKYSIDWADIAKAGGLPHVYFGGVWDYLENEAAMKLAEESHTQVLDSVHVCTTDNTGWSRGIVMRRFILSRGGGVLLWYEKGADGEMYQEIAAVTRIAAKYEPFFQKGNTLAFAPHNGVLTYGKDNPTPPETQRVILGNVEPKMPSLVVYEYQGKFLAIAMNDTDKPYQARLLFKKATGMVYDAESEKAFSPDNELDVTIPRFSFRAFTGQYDN